MIRIWEHRLPVITALVAVLAAAGPTAAGAVSYTHLTLPRIQHGTCRCAPYH